jgi:hypothetical protein
MDNLDTLHMARKEGEKISKEIKDKHYYRAIVLVGAVRRAHNDGMSIKDACKEIGIRPQNLARLARNHGLPTLSSGKVD